MGWFEPNLLLSLVKVTNSPYLSLVKVTNSPSLSLVKVTLPSLSLVKVTNSPPSPPLSKCQTLHKLDRAGWNHFQFTGSALGCLNQGVVLLSSELGQSLIDRLGLEGKVK
eukprot:sb/3477290/